MLRTTVSGIVIGLGYTVVTGFAPSATADPPATDTPGVVQESFAVHGEFTYVEQEDSDFTAPYAGANSLTPDNGRETTDASLSIGAALWSGAEVWIDPEVDQGSGLDNTLGVAGFPNGEAYKIGSNAPYFRLQRLFVRETLNAEGEREPVEPSAGTLGGEQSVNRWVFTLGKFSVTDVFDNNSYAHDPRGDFLNWAALDAGAFDYAADAWGYTVGAAAEWYHGQWTLRAGIFDLSDVPNSARLEPGFDEFQMIAEVEHRHEIAGLAGKLLITGFESRGRMGLLDEAVELADASGTAANVAAVREYRSRFGGLVNFEQALPANLGIFARYSKAAGNVEAYEFSDIDRSIEVGLSLKGVAWRRDRDTVGIALIDNGISAGREQYLNAGGLGILVGDGKLPHPGPEEIVETYYSAALCSYAQLTLDYQRIENPAYNRDRGPVSVFAVRVHAQF
ncbi:MAG TPA: carbohydrate porin [Steroidobacteraceae bacterium]